MRINRQNLKWLGRMMLILLVVGVAEVLVLDSDAYSFAHNPSHHSSHGQGREASPPSVW